MKTSTLTQFLLLALFISVSVNGEVAPLHSAAALNDNRYSLQNRIKFPKQHDNFRETVVCEASIDRGGRFSSNFCYSEDEDISSKLVRVIHNAAKGAKITPARVNGNGQWALYQYSVEFVQQDEQQRIAVNSYQGYNKVLSPASYSAPQRILRKKWSSIPGCPLKMRVALKVDVSADGEPSNAQFLFEKPNDVCAASILRWSTRQSYVPAMLDGKAVSSIHVEYVLGSIDWRGSQVK